MASKGVATCKNVSKFCAIALIYYPIYTLVSIVNTNLNANLNTMSLASLAMEPRIHSALPTALAKRVQRFVRLVFKKNTSFAYHLIRPLISRITL